MSKNRRVLISILAIVALGSLGLAAFMVAQDAYTVYDGETAVPVSGSFNTVGDVIEAAGLTLRAEDAVAPPPDAAAQPQQPIYIQRAAPIEVTSPDGTRTLWTRQLTLGAFLAEAGINVQPAHRVRADGQDVAWTALDDTPLPAQVDIAPSLTVTIIDGEQPQTLTTRAQTVGAALQEAGITLYASDGVEPPLGTWLVPNQQIRIERAKPLTIVVDGRSIATRSYHSSAPDVLAEAGVGLVGQDYTRPGPETVLRPGDTIEVVRVTETVRTEDETLPFTTVYQPSDQLALDTLAVLSNGTPGIRRTAIRSRYENGELVSETIDGEWIAQAAVNQVIGYGTQINLGVVDTPEGPREYWRVVRMRVTAYTAATAGRAPDHPAYGITASGVPAGKGVVAIDPNVVPFRSYVYVPGYGIGFAGDTGGGVKGRWIDLGFDDGAIETWNGYVDVYYLTPVPAPEDINYLLPQVLP